MTAVAKHWLPCARSRSLQDLLQEDSLLPAGLTWAGPSEHHPSISHPTQTWSAVAPDLRTSLSRSEPGQALSQAEGISGEQSRQSPGCLPAFQALLCGDWVAAGGGFCHPGGHVMRFLGGGRDPAQVSGVLVSQKNASWLLELSPGLGTQQTFSNNNKNNNNSQRARHRSAWFTDLMSLDPHSCPMK